MQNLTTKFYVIFTDVGNPWKACSECEKVPLKVDTAAYPSAAELSVCFLFHCNVGVEIICCYGVIVVTTAHMLHRTWNV